MTVKLPSSTMSVAIAEILQVKLVVSWWCIAVVDVIFAHTCPGRPVVYGLRRRVLLEPVTR